MAIILFFLEKSMHTQIFVEQSLVCYDQFILYI